VTARQALTHPITLAAIVLLVLNDHVLKAAAPGFVTGKLSDVAGMIFFPVMLAAALEWLGARSKHLMLGTAIATGVGFAAIKTIDVAADAYRVGLGALQWPFRVIKAFVVDQPVPALAEVRLTMDATDLIAVPAVMVAVWLVRERAPQRVIGTIRTSA
jgi:hypothetical protein